MDAGMLLGAFINHTPFHLSIDEGLIYHCQATLSCDLDITISDAELVKERTREFLQLASDVDWICELYLPQRLGYEGLSTLMETASMTGTSAEDLLDQDQSDGHGPEDGILSDSLFTAAKGFNRWKEFLKLARRTAFKIPDTLPPSTLARAWQEVGRWDLARKWSLKKGLSEGRYPKAPWLCPCYLRALIETGDDIEALRLLMQHEDGEPGFYSLLRGRALRSAGDHTGAKEAFDHYDMNWPGDILGQSEISALND